jgi:phosphoribosyl-ATP pyrophosphohydrolase
MDNLLESEAGPLDPITQLESDIQLAAGDPQRFPRTSKLINAGAPQQAKKMVEEATELAIEAVRNNREAAVQEAADLLYNLAVLLEGMDLRFEDICKELERRRCAFGIAAKLPKSATSSLMPGGK